MKRYFLLIWLLLLGCNGSDNGEPVKKNEAVIAEINSTFFTVGKMESNRLFEATSTKSAIVSLAGNDDYYFLVIDGGKKEASKKEISKSLSTACKKLDVVVFSISGDGAIISGALSSANNQCSMIQSMQIELYGDVANVDFITLQGMQLRSFNISTTSSTKQGEAFSENVGNALNGMHLEHLGFNSTGITVTPKIIDSISSSQSSLTSLYFIDYKDMNLLMNKLLEFSALQELIINAPILDSKDLEFLREFKKEYEKRYSRKLVVMVMGAEP